VGARVDFDDIVTLNVRYEILYYQFGINAPTDGCTAFAVSPERSADGHLLIGQNWDWVPDVRGAVLRTLDPDGHWTLSFTEAGVVGGKIGLSSAGIGLTINGLTTTSDDWSRIGKPFHLRCYEILRARDLNRAIAIAAERPWACSANPAAARAPWPRS
jgi:isopenicillin-N N-acyltransferase-like protein